MARPRRRSPARPSARPTLERSIYFYRIDAGTNDAGQPLAFDPAPPLGRIEGLDFSSDGRYLDEVEGDVLCCWIDRNQAPQRLKLARIRRSGLPLVEQDGDLEPLRIAESAGLAEQIHIVLFPGDRIAAAEFNFFGPRLTRLGGYLETKGGSPDVRFRPLLRGDVLEQLDRISQLRLVELRVRESYVQTIDRVNQNLGNTLREALHLGNADAVDLTLSKRGRGWLRPQLLQSLKRLARREDIHQGAERFIIRGLNTQTERIDEVDILKDALIARKQILRQDPRTRALVSESAYAAIQEAYAELRPEVLRAAEIGE